jgi:signal transduction histidine kinase
MKALYFLALMARTASSIFNPRCFAQGGISASVADESGVHLSIMSTTARLLSGVGEVRLRLVVGLCVQLLSCTFGTTVACGQPHTQLTADHSAQRDAGMEAVGARGPAQSLERASVWERYDVYLLGAAAVLVAQWLLIAGLVAQRRKRRAAEDRLRSGEEALRSSSRRIDDLGARLLHAQDTERSRIARELHDDISQQVGLLSMNLELLYEAVPPGTEALAGDALDQAREIARKIHDLSHRLHPTRLRLTGLVAALQTLQRELSRPGTTITFTYDRVPANLPVELTLSLFRVVQEALQNALKHGQGRTVAVDLRGASNGLALTISDDGEGFNIDAEWGTGLGLISMSERIEAVGGTFDVRSRPGEGTFLTITVPIAVDPAAEMTAIERAG